MQIIERFNTTTFEDLVARTSADANTKLAFRYMYHAVQTGMTIDEAKQQAETAFDVNLSNHNNLFYGGVTTLDVYEADVQKLVRKMGPGNRRFEVLKQYDLRIMQELVGMMAR